MKIISISTCDLHFICNFPYKQVSSKLKIFSIQIGSYIHDDTQIRFTGSFDHDAENQRAQQYELVAKELDYNDTFIIHANRYFIDKSITKIIGLQITMW